MKQLQNDFTTPEQSKSLLRLGVPADSANYAYMRNEMGNMCRVFINRPYTIYSENVKRLLDRETFPCWSVGRLIEITFECDKRKVSITYKDIVPCKGTIIERIINILEYAIECNDIDFSKLEE